MTSITDLIASAWRFNIEFSLLLMLVLCARFTLRSTNKSHNAYLLWLCLPIGLALSAIAPQFEKLISQSSFAQLAPSASIQESVHNYVITPSTNYFAWSPALVYLLAIISTLMLLRLLLQHKELRRNLSEISVKPAPNSPNIRSSYTIRLVDQIDFSPAVYGFFKPTIYFPLHLLETLDSEQIELIVRHEEHHIKQGHLWLNLFWDLLVCCMWFNPFVYFARQQFRHDQELYCDYLV